MSEQWCLSVCGGVQEGRAPGWLETGRGCIQETEYSHPAHCSRARTYRTDKQTAVTPPSIKTVSKGKGSMKINFLTSVKQADAPNSVHYYTLRKLLAILDNDSRLLRAVISNSDGLLLPKCRLKMSSVSQSIKVFNSEVRGQGGGEGRQRGRRITPDTNWTVSSLPGFCHCSL